MDIKTQYNTFHSTYSENFDVENELSNRLFHETIDSSLRGKKLLDIGCGDGTDCAVLATRGAEIYGVDPSIEFIEKARDAVLSGVFKEGVGEKLPFNDKSFDIVVSKWALQTSPNVPAVLSEAARILKTGGELIILSKHPVMQWLEKIRDYGHGADYYRQQTVTSNIYDGRIMLKEPSHTMNEYLNSDFFRNFELINFREETEFPASEQLNGDIYPTFFIIKARRK